MRKKCGHHDVLVIRPWLSTANGGDAYAHFDALAMRERIDRRDGRYGDYWVLSRGDDERKTFRLDQFRFQCQIDDRKPVSYGWHWGYQPSNGSIFSARDMALYGSSLAAIDRAMDRLYREDGPTEGTGRFVVRLARVLKLDGIVLLETSANGSFRDEMQVRRRVEPGDYGDAIRTIDDLVLELHRACAKRVGKMAA